MERYANLSGKQTGVESYEIGEGFIILRFVNGKNYRYTEASTGLEDVAKMQKLARAGQGLSTFVVRHIKDRYEEKW